MFRKGRFLGLFAFVDIEVFIIIRGNNLSMSSIWVFKSKRNGYYLNSPFRIPSNRRQKLYSKLYLLCPVGVSIGKLMAILHQSRFEQN